MLHAFWAHVSSTLHRTLQKLFVVFGPVGAAARTVQSLQLLEGLIPEALMDLWIYWRIDWRS
jgi:hypothetical protein